MKQDGRSLSHDVLEAYRLSAIKLHKENVRIDVIAESFGVTPQAVYKWIRTASEHGIKALRSTKAPGPAPSLEEGQLYKLLSLLKRPASEYNYATDLWSGPRIRHFIRKRYGVTYHPKHMPRFLRRLGLVLKFPERRALEQDPVAIRKWKKGRLPKLLEYAKKKRGLMFYADESLISLIPYVGKTWALPDARPLVRVSGLRGQHIGVTAAVNAKGRLCFELTGEKEKFTAKVFLRFIRKMRQEYPSRSIVLIVDGAPIHKAKVVKAYEFSNKQWLRLEILPAYSPELNPTEKAWDFLKTKKMNGSQAQSKKQLRGEVSKSMRSLKKNTVRVSSFFNASK
jgi:transposase